MADALVDALVALHAVDPDEVGLGDLGRRDGYLERQLRRWLGQSEKATASVQAPRLPDLAARLGESMPQSPPSRIVHGDYRMDNCVYDADDPGRIWAILDWELSTLVTRSPTWRRPRCTGAMPTVRPCRSSRA